MMRIGNPRAIIGWLSLTLITSCDRTGHGHLAKADPFIVNLDATAAHSSLAGIVDSIKAIQLETNDSSVLSDPYSIKRVIYKGSRFFVLDQKFFSVKVFDSTGKYLYDIGRLGLGHGEWMHLEDIECNFTGDQLVVLTNRPSKLLIFTFDGRLVKEQNLDFFASQIAFPSENSRIFYINQHNTEVTEGNNLLFTDSNNVIQDKMFCFPHDLTTVIMMSGGLHSTQHGIYYNPAFSDSFYTITGDTATPSFKANFGDRQIPAAIGQNELFSNLKKYSYPCATLIRHKGYIGLNYQQGGRASAFFNTRTGKIAASDIGADSLNRLFTNYMFEGDGKLVMILDIDQLKDFITRNASIIQQRYPDLFTNIHMQKNRQNPILLTFTLRSI